MKKILIAVDEGPTSEKIAEAGITLGLQLKAELAVLSVVNTEFLVTDGAMTPREMLDMLRLELIQKQKMILEKLAVVGKVWTFIEQGKPHEVIIRTADEWNAGLIVLGTHGRTGLKHLLMGSTAEKVIRHSTKPLLVIPAK